MGKIIHSKKYLLIALSFLLFVGRGVAQISVESAPYTEFEVPSGNSLKVYIIAPKLEFSISFKGGAGDKLMSFSEDISKAVEVPNAIYTAGAWVIKNPKLDCAYFLKKISDSSPICYWFVDYYAKQSKDVSLLAKHSSADLCSTVVLEGQEYLDNFFYKTKEGIEVPIVRKFTLTYEDLKWDEEGKVFSPYTHTVELTAKGQKITLLSSLTDTHYTIEKDQFSDLLAGAFLPLSSNNLESKRLEIHPIYTLDGEDEEKEFSKDLSAPAKVILKVIANEPVAGLYSWKIIQGVENTLEAPLLMQFNGPETTYTFDKVGSYTILLDVTTRDGQCTVSADPKKVQVQTSLLEVPNAFSPHSSPGINDVFLVHSKSLVTFQGIIFNEWGERLFEWKDPKKGWDGTFRGKPVESGVYYYIIKAKGADGKEYNLNGHINILQSDLQQQAPRL